MSDQTTAAGEVNPEKLDPNMRLEDNVLRGFVWHSPDESPIRISGFAWYQQDHMYRRMPIDPSVNMPDAVHQLANCTAGGQISFRTDSARLAISVELTAPANMYHMPATGQCGFDVYVGEPGHQQFLSTARFDHHHQGYEVILFQLPKGETRHVTLNFPLYQGVGKVSVGIDEGASLLAPIPYASGEKILFYGTSITQGGCASRPGMAYTNILSRRIPLECINLGFSGNGKGEPEVARIISGIASPALLVLDYEANVQSCDQYSETLPKFIRIFREAHPIVPILVVSKIQYAAEICNSELLERRLRMNQIAIQTVRALTENGDCNLHFLDGEHLLGDADYHECTVDGVHPTDLGFFRMANGLTPVLQSILK
ncbi:SGNH/GDSL hydrolase family protein [Paenibacillus sp. Soil750]|uniref:SGNH/GDSL hydrolase family protein n=1 Tax=Paenibacillus sp. Soil750 TaxID=1736398 RepID=UPI000B294400|nr:SGNH/GDSL hydrolase family protein [Paenibacillus sp. Soil750]